MKQTKRLIALALVLVMALALTVPALAAGGTITVEDAQVGETYKAYKVLELTVDNEAAPTSYSYTVNSGWENFFTDASTSEYYAIWTAVFEKDSGGHITAKPTITDQSTWVASSPLVQFAEAAAKYAKAQNIAAVDTKTVSTGATSVVLNTSANGYYLVTSTLGTRAMVDTTPGDVTIKEKNALNTVDKKVKEDKLGDYTSQNDAQIGDTIEFKTEVTVVPRTVKLKIHDTMDNGLTFNSESIKIYTDSAMTTTLDASYYTIQTIPDSGDTFTIQIADTFSATVGHAQTLFITYSATLNQNAISTTPAIVDQKNTATLTFGDKTSTSSTTTTTTHKFMVYKHENNKQDNLAGAVFSIYSDENCTNLVKLIKIDDNNYRVAMTDETNAVESFTTVATDDIVIWGVDSDNDNIIDYYLKEIQAPAGYHNITTATPVRVGADNSTQVPVINHTGSELPSTGGAGLYVVAGVALLALLAFGGTALVKKRVNGAE